MGAKVAKPPQRRASAVSSVVRIDEGCAEVLEVSPSKNPEKENVQPLPQQRLSPTVSPQRRSPPETKKAPLQGVKPPFPLDTEEPDPDAGKGLQVQPTAVRAPGQMPRHAAEIESRNRFKKKIPASITGEKTRTETLDDSMKQAWLTQHRAVNEAIFARNPEFHFPEETHSRKRSKPGK